MFPPPQQQAMVEPMLSTIPVFSLPSFRSLPSLRWLSAALLGMALAGCTGDKPSTPTIDGGKSTAADATFSKPQADALPRRFGDGAGGSTVQDRVLFDYDRATIKAEFVPVIERAAAWMRQYPNIRIDIEGHSDEHGTREYNLALGSRRAEALRAALVSAGVPSSQIVQTVTYGKERPAVVGSSEQSWSQNRRAVMVVD
jgi:peptidoglycan-associated lipoprotein